MAHVGGGGCSGSGAHPRVLLHRADAHNRARHVDKQQAALGDALEQLARATQGAHRLVQRPLAAKRTVGRSKINLTAATPYACVRQQHRTASREKPFYLGLLYL